MWSGRKCHPDDLRACEFTGVPINFEFTTAKPKTGLQPLVELLQGCKRTADEPKLWDHIAAKASDALRSKCRVETAHFSPDHKHLAVCSEVRSFLGLRVHQAGLVYSIGDEAIVGHIAIGKRTPKGWVDARS